MEQKDRDDGKRWSERQVGVYHSFDLRGSNPASVIVLHAMPSSRLQQRMDDAFRNGYFRKMHGSSHMMLHVLILSTYMNNWRWYMDELGEECLDLVSIRGRDIIQY